jgi:hypothetical protein
MMGVSPIDDPLDNSIDGPDPCCCRIKGISYFLAVSPTVGCSLPFPFEDVDGTHESPPSYDLPDKTLRGIYGDSMLFNKSQGAVQNILGTNKAYVE